MKLSASNFIKVASVGAALLLGTSASASGFFWGYHRPHRPVVVPVPVVVPPGVPAPVVVPVPVVVRPPVRPPWGWGPHRFGPGRHHR